MKNKNLFGLANTVSSCFASMTIFSSVLYSVLLTGSVAQAAETVLYKPQASAHIRTLAASCAACHGTNGNSVVVNNASSNNPDQMHHLAGIDANYFTTQMLAFKNGERKATVMHHHAKGLNIDEINLLAMYFSQQKQVVSISPKSQLLKVDHD